MNQVHMNKTSSPYTIVTFLYQARRKEKWNKKQGTTGNQPSREAEAVVVYNEGSIKPHAAEP
jgi:hypothetical protein